MSWHPHVTVATVVERDGRFLVVQERIDGAIRYNQPAGHLEPGESLGDAAIRETLEETGWTVELSGVVGLDVYLAPANGETYVRTTFIAKALTHDPSRPLDTGIEAALWLSRDEIAHLSEQLRSPMVLQVIDQFLAGKQFPLEVVGNGR